MSELVHDLTSSMEATPPPPHTLGAHLLGAKYSSGEHASRSLYSVCQGARCQVWATLCVMPGVVLVTLLTAVQLAGNFATSFQCCSLSPAHTPGVPLDRAQIMADIGIMWGAGFETTAHTICWALSLLSTHPEAEARLCAELDSLGLLVTPERPTPAPLQWEHLGQVCVC